MYKRLLKVINGLGPATKVAFWRCYWFRCHKRPSKSNTITTIKSTPSSPLGPYPQPAEYGQRGNAPTSNKIKMMSKIVPIVSPRRFENLEPDDHKQNQDHDRVG